jgi:hypothetical protein
MKRTRFQERVKLITIDLNALHELTEEGLGELIKAMSGGLDTLLFDNAPPTFITAPGTITISVPAQRFAAAGVVGNVLAAATVHADPGPDMTYNIFFVVGRTDVSDWRDRLILAPLSVASENVVVEDDPVSRIEITTNPAPVLGVNDIGYVKLGSVDKVLGVWSVTHNTAELYSFPGLGPSYANHGAKHIDPLQDPIPLATPAGGIGLMPLNSYPVLLQALQQFEVDGAMPWLVRVITGDNTPGNPRTATLSVRVSSSFRTVDVSGNPGLGLDFSTDPYAGDSNRPARWNHRHRPEESPIAVLTQRVTAGSADLGTLMAELTFTGIARIYQTQVFWAKPGTTSPEHPAVPCCWAFFPPSGSVVNGTVGAKAIITGNNKVQVEVGDVAFTHMNAATVAMLGVVNWQYAGGDPSFPRNGELFVRVTGIR